MTSALPRPLADVDQPPRQAVSYAGPTVAMEPCVCPCPLGSDDLTMLGVILGIPDRNGPPHDVAVVQSEAVPLNDGSIKGHAATRSRKRKRASTPDPSKYKSQSQRQKEEIALLRQQVIELTATLEELQLIKGVRRREASPDAADTCRCSACGRRGGSAIDARSRAGRTRKQSKSKRGCARGTARPQTAHGAPKRVRP